jgi:polygalacturonase
MGKGVPSLNALSFGATANGNDVDTEAIQKAIDECSSMAGCWHVKLTCPKGQKTCIYMSGMCARKLAAAWVGRLI